MKNKFYYAVLAVGMLLLTIGCTSPVKYADLVGKSFIRQWENPDSIHWKGQKNHFTWQAGYIMYSMEKMWEFTGDSVYYKYIQRYVDQQVDEEGNVPDFNPRALDNFAPGYAILFMYEQTGKEKYKIAAEKIRRGFDTYPRNENELFWHSQSMKNQSWVDGVYMGQIFLARYGQLIGDKEYAFAEVVKQMTRIVEVCGKENGLLVHAWDESKRARWAHPENGQSSDVWSEGLGWYAILIADIFDYLPIDQPGRDDLMKVLQKLCMGLKDAQDTQSGMWCQVVDKSQEPGNWNETSGTGMFMYLLQKAINKGYIDASTYQPIVDKAYTGIIQKQRKNPQGEFEVFDCSSIGVKRNYEEYISQPREINPFTGFGSFMIGAGSVEYNK